MEGWEAGLQISPGVWEDCPGSQTQLRLERAHQCWAGCGRHHLLLLHWMQRASWLVQRQKQSIQMRLPCTSGRKLVVAVLMVRRHTEIPPCASLVVCISVRYGGSQGVISGTGSVMRSPHSKPGLPARTSTLTDPTAREEVSASWVLTDPLAGFGWHSVLLLASSDCIGGDGFTRDEFKV